MSERTSPWMQTFSGRTFRLIDPKPEMFNLQDIAHHLACSTRFNGATVVPYSIAQHCVLVSHLVPAKCAKEGLGHEIAEPYTGDIAYPMKCALELEAPGVLKRIERTIEAAGAATFGLVYPWPPEVKVADLAMLVAERNVLMAKPNAFWDVDDETGDPRFVALVNRGETMLRAESVWDFETAERRFLARWTEVFS